MLSAVCEKAGSTSVSLSLVNSNSILQFCFLIGKINFFSERGRSHPQPKLPSWFNKTVSTQFIGTKGTIQQTRDNFSAILSSSNIWWHRIEYLLECVTYILNCQKVSPAFLLCRCLLMTSHFKISLFQFPFFTKQDPSYNSGGYFFSKKY